MSTNPYDVLGVSKTAAAEEIKIAQRALLKKYHPDFVAQRVASLPKAEQEKQISAAKDVMSAVNVAYGILSDSEKRKKYDRGLIDDQGQEIFGAVNTAETVKDIFAEFGVGTAPKPAPASGLNVTKKLTLGFIEAALGASASIETADRVMTVRLPEGIEHGRKMKLEGKGNSSGGRTGDMILEISITPHKFFTRDGNNIRIDLPVHFHEAVLGGAIEVPTIRGSAKLSLPASGAMVKDGSEMRLPGAGIRGGDQIMTVKIVQPEREALKGWAAAQNLANPRANLKS